MTMGRTKKVKTTLPPDLKGVDAGLYRLGLERVQVAKDGSCLFRAVAQQYFGTQEQHLILRRKCADYIKANREHFKEFLVRPIDDYVQALYNPEYWGGEPEIAALHKMLRCDIVIYKEEGSTKVTKKVYCDSSIKNSSVVHLVFMGNEHYDSAYPKNWRTSAAVCQSILTDLLYQEVLKLDTPTSSSVDKILKKSHPPFSGGTWVHSKLEPASFSKEVLQMLSPNHYRNISVDTFESNKQAQEDTDLSIAMAIQHSAPRFAKGDDCEVQISRSRGSGSDSGGRGSSVWIRGQVTEAEKEKYRVYIPEQKQEKLFGAEEMRPLDPMKVQSSPALQSRNVSHGNQDPQISPRKTKQADHPPRRWEDRSGTDKYNSNTSQSSLAGSYSGKDGSRSRSGRGGVGRGGGTRVYAKPGDQDPPTSNDKTALELTTECDKRGNQKGVRGQVKRGSHLHHSTNEHPGRKSWNRQGPEADGVGQPHGSDELSSAVAMDSANPKSPPHIESEKQQNEYGNWHGNHSFKADEGGKAVRPSGPRPVHPPLTSSDPPLKPTRGWENKNSVTSHALPISIQPTAEGRFERATTSQQKGSTCSSSSSSSSLCETGTKALASPLSLGLSPWPTGNNTTSLSLAGGEGPPVKDGSTQTTEEVEESSHFTTVFAKLPPPPLSDFYDKKFSSTDQFFIEYGQKCFDVYCELRPTAREMFDSIHPPSEWPDIIPDDRKDERLVSQEVSQPATSKVQPVLTPTSTALTDVESVVVVPQQGDAPRGVGLAEDDSVLDSPIVHQEHLHQQHQEHLHQQHQEHLQEYQEHLHQQHQEHLQEYQEHLHQQHQEHLQEYQEHQEQQPQGNSPAVIDESNGESNDATSEEDHIVKEPGSQPPPMPYPPLGLPQPPMMSYYGMPHPPGPFYQPMYSHHPNWGPAPFPPMMSSQGNFPYPPYFNHLVMGVHPRLPSEASPHFSKDLELSEPSQDLTDSPPEPSPSKDVDTDSPPGPSPSQDVEVDSHPGPSVSRDVNTDIPPGSSPFRNADLHSPPQPFPLREDDLHSPPGSFPSREADLHSPLGSFPSREADLHSPPAPFPSVGVTPKLPSPTCSSQSSDVCTTSSNRSNATPKDDEWVESSISPPVKDGSPIAKDVSSSEAATTGSESDYQSFKLKKPYSHGRCTQDKHNPQGRFPQGRQYPHGRHTQDTKQYTSGRYSQSNKQYTGGRYSQDVKHKAKSYSQNRVGKSLTQHHSTSTQYHGTLTQHHSTSTQHHSTSTQHHGTSTQHHGTSTQHHGTSTQHHGTSTQHHGTSTQHHGTSTQHHGTATQHHGTSTQHHGTSTQHHGTNWRGGLNNTTKNRDTIVTKPSSLKFKQQPRAPERLTALADSESRFRSKVSQAAIPDSGGHIDYDIGSDDMSPTAQQRSDIDHALSQYNMSRDEFHIESFTYGKNVPT